MYIYIHIYIYINVCRNSKSARGDLCQMLCQVIELFIECSSNQSKTKLLNVKSHTKSISFVWLLTFSGSEDGSIEKLKLVTCKIL
jgi:hypothetical protein